ncbi:MAG: aminotransferase class I/II-fold pyridoxal phosphate-dependent enzyme [Bacteroidota bacterium]
MIINPAQRIGSVKEYYFSTKLKEIARLRKAGHSILNLGIGSPDLAPAQTTIEQLVRQSRYQDNHAYQSYRGIPELREAFAQWYQRHFSVGLDPEKNILPMIGSKEGIMHISMAFLEEGDEVLVPNPGYPAYRSTALLAGARIRPYTLDAQNDWLPNLKALAEQDLSRVKIMWVNYPHMPTGARANHSFFESLLRFAKEQQILICHDNPYSFILNEQAMSLLAIEGAEEVALELNSLSKSHNMAGWRIGMLAGHPDYLDAVMKFKSNMDSGMFKPLQLAAVEALAQPKEWYEKLNMVYRSRREKVYAIMDRLNCVYNKGQAGMFVWAQIPDHYQDAYQLSDELLYGADVFITPGGIFGSQGNRYVRISLCSEISIFEETIRRIDQHLAKSTQKPQA